MGKTRFLILTMMTTIFVFTQNDSTLSSQKLKNRYGLWFIPSAATNIYGIAIGPLGSEVICNQPYTKYSHGINLQVPGQGFIQTFNIGRIKFNKIDSLENGSSVDTIPKRVIHNGLLISLFGTFSDQVNGISISSWMSLGKKMNGLSINLLCNLYQELNGVVIGAVNHVITTNGVQIGLVNKTRFLRGIQIGLWNVNQRRSLPIINWSF
jgi:hypothetical protein